jgi:hypothetical protein
MAILLECYKGRYHTQKGQSKKFRLPAGLTAIFGPRFAACVVGGERAWDQSEHRIHP